MPDIDLTASQGTEAPIQTETATPEPAVEETQEVEVEQEEAPAPRRSQDRTVPLSALVEERRRYHSKLDILRGEIEALKKGVSKHKDQPQTDEAKHKEQWLKHLGIDEMRDRLDEIAETMESLTSKVSNVDQLSHGAQLAVRQYVRNVEDYAIKQYDESLPISKTQFEKLVAAEITPEDAEEIYTGNYNAIDNVVKRVKAEFKGKSNSQIVKKAAEVGKVNRLPKIPAQGGQAPQAKEEEQNLTGKALHDSAWELFKNSQSRRQE